MARVGILGGTFNPPHLGHLAIARAALAELGLARVVLMPVHTAPHKHEAPDPGPQHRLAMCRLLAAGEDGVEVCDLEVRRPGPSFTVATLRSIHASQPDVQLTFVLGADSAATLPSWREPRALLELAALAVAAREGSDRERVQAAIAEVSTQARVSFLELPEIDVSASMVRARAAVGDSVEPLVGAAVSDYIALHGLYRGV